MATFAAMEQPSYNPIIQDFFEWVQKNRVLGLIDPASTEKAWYLPHHLLKTYFASSQYYHLKKLLSVVYQGEEIPVDPDDVARRYSSVFCILLFIGKARYIQRFAQSDKLQDSNLPFIHPEEFPSGADHEDNQEVFERFYQRQWMFCAPELNYRNERVFDENRVLPMVITDILKPGGSANLYKVVLDKNYNYLLNDDGNVPVCISIVSQSLADWNRRATSTPTPLFSKPTTAPMQKDISITKSVLLKEFMPPHHQI